MQYLIDVQSVNANDKTNYVFDQAFDSEFLVKTYGNNFSFCLKLFNLFLSTCKSEMAALDSAISSKNFQQVRDLVHRTKNNFYYIGLPELQMKMQELSNTTQQNPEALNDKYETFVDEYEKALVLVKLEQKKLQNYYAH